MTTEHQEELDRLKEELMERADQKGSVISTVELSGLHQRGDIEALRFHHKYWDGSSSSQAGISLSVSSVTYKAAQIIGEDPNNFVTDNHFEMVRRLWPIVGVKRQRISRMIELAPYMALVLGNPELEEHFVSLMTHRGISNVDELREALEGVAGIPTAMHEGAL